MFRFYTIPLCLLLASTVLQAQMFSDQILISSEANGAQSVYSADLDGDGDFDVLSASFGDDKIAWYENIDGLGYFSMEHVISTDADCASSVFSADFDGDGDYDVLSGSGHREWELGIYGNVAWYENTDGLGGFGPAQFIMGGGGKKYVYSADLDGDGDYDVLLSSRLQNIWWEPFDETRIAWYENLDGLGDFGPEQLISDEIYYYESVFAADLDGDGDKDVLTACAPAIYWYENTDGLGDFGPEQIVSDEASAVESVYAEDIDQDGDIDVLGALRHDHQITWYENIDGLGEFGEQQVITNETWGADCVIGSDLDLDGDIDVLSASLFDDQIAWYENLDGLGSFGQQQIITTDADQAESVFCADLDGDGDQDVLSASHLDDKIAWYRNESITADLELEISPWDNPILIEAGGGNFRWDATVENVTDEIVVFDAWTSIILPSGLLYEPLNLYPGLTLPPGGEMVGSPNQYVPGFAQDGDYLYFARVGDFDSGEVIAAGFFEFTKLPAQGFANNNMNNGDGWILSEFFETSRNNEYDLVSGIPENYIMENAWPNPFNLITHITIGLADFSQVQLNVYNTLGQKVASLADGQYSAGYYTFEFDGLGLSSGIYFVQMVVPGQYQKMQKVVIMK